MLTLLWVIYILDCLLLIGIILLQPGEGGDLAAAFGGASSQTAFGARGSASVLQRVTTTLAVLFMLLSIILVIATNMKQRNILERNLQQVQTPVAPQKTAPAAPAQKTPAAPAAPTPAPAPATAPEKAPAK